MVGRLGRSSLLEELLPEAVNSVPIVLPAGLLFLAFMTSGSFALFLSLLFYISKLWRYHEMYLEALLQERDKSALDAMLGEFNFHLCLCLLWTLNTFLVSPSLVFWAINLKGGIQLRPDPAFLISLTFISSLVFLWRDGTPSMSPKCSWWLGACFHVMLITLPLWGEDEVHLLPIFTSLVFLALSLGHLISHKTKQD